MISGIRQWLAAFFYWNRAVLACLVIWGGFLVVLIVRAEAWRARRIASQHGLPLTREGP